MVAAPFTRFCERIWLMSSRSQTTDWLERHARSFVEGDLPRVIARRMHDVRHTHADIDGSL
jgi:hypothetical protein